ncbi:unnamed protein product [Echinostoma caproni]|uniref:PhoLip_ATPase_C domain-containing protein n=1 Tax=Echinostoma caproni TaxID=27848 RepID=A0A183AXY1_9TREM|nr:unnamed protein product [Echinostoma caproni]
MVVPSLPTDSYWFDNNGTYTLDYPWIARLFRGHIQPNASMFDSIKFCMMILLYAGAVITTLPLIPVLFAFKSEPPSEPTYAQYMRKQVRRRVKHLDDEAGMEANQRSTECSMETVRSRSGSHTVRNNQVAPLTETSPVLSKINHEDETSLDTDSTISNGDYKSSLLRVIRNRQYVLLFFSYGINTGVYYALGTLLNFILLDFFPVSICAINLSSNIFNVWTSILFYEGLYNVPFNHIAAGADNSITTPASAFNPTFRVFMYF